MIVQLVLINHETGEPIYDAVLAGAEILQGIRNVVLEDHAHKMLRALQEYKPRTVIPVKLRNDPLSADFDAGTDGAVDMGY